MRAFLPRYNLTVTEPYVARCHSPKFSVVHCHIHTSRAHGTFANVCAILTAGLPVRRSAHPHHRRPLRLAGEGGHPAHAGPAHRQGRGGPQAVRTAAADHLSEVPGRPGAPDIVDRDSSKLFLA